MNPDKEFHPALERRTWTTGFRRTDRPLSRRQLTSVIDETAPAVIQHARLISAMQDKIREQDARLKSVESRLAPMKARYRLYRLTGLSRWLSVWRAL